VRALLIAAALSLALPAAGAAKLRPYIPPSNSGANEYVESVPTAAGNNSTGNVIESGASGPSVLAPSTRSALATQGRDGRATAALASATAPATLRDRHRRHVAPGAGGSSGAGSSGAGSSGAGSSGGGVPAGSGGSPAAAVLKSIFGLQGGGGAVLPVLLILAALVLGAERMWRRRTS
jgi:uncharacterized membrane protein